MHQAIQTPNVIANNTSPATITKSPIKRYHAPVKPANVRRFTHVVLKTEQDPHAHGTFEQSHTGKRQLSTWPTVSPQPQKNPTKHCKKAFHIMSQIGHTKPTTDVIAPLCAQQQIPTRLSRVLHPGQFSQISIY